MTIDDVVEVLQGTTHPSDQWRSLRRPAQTIIIVRGEHIQANFEDARTSCSQRSSNRHPLENRSCCPHARACAGPGWSESPTTAITHTLPQEYPFVWHSTGSSTGNAYSIKPGIGVPEVAYSTNSAGRLDCSRNSPMSNNACSMVATRFSVIELP